MESSSSSELVQVEHNHSRVHEEVQENEEFLIDDDVTHNVLEMLNFKIVPKVPEDPGYAIATTPLPHSEARYYAAEYCRMHQEIVGAREINVQLKKQISEREEELKNEKLKLVEKNNHIQKAEKSALEYKICLGKLSIVNSEQKDKLAAEVKRNEDLKRELDELKKQLSVTQCGVKTAQSELESSRTEVLNLKEQLGSQKETHNREVEEVQGIILEREHEVTDHQNVISNLRKDLEKTEKDFIELQSKMEELKKQYSDTQLELAASQENNADLQKRLDLKIEESNQQKTNSDSSKEKIVELEAKVKDMEVNSLEQQQNLEQTAEKNRNLEDKVKELDTRVSVKQGEFEDLKKSFEGEQQAKLGLEIKCKKLRAALSDLNLEFAQFTQEIKNAVGEGVPGSTEEDVITPQKKLELLSLNLKTKFQSWQDNQKLTQEELTKIKLGLASLLKLSNTQRQRTDVATQTSPSQILMSALSKKQPYVTLKKLHPNQLPPKRTPLAFPGPSYRDVLLRTLAKPAAPVPQQNSTAFNCSAQRFHSNEVYSTPLNNLSSCSPSLPTTNFSVSLANLNSVNSASSSSSNKVSRSKCSTSEVRQLFVDETNIGSGNILSNIRNGKTMENRPSEENIITPTGPSTQVNCNEICVDVDTESQRLSPTEVESCTANNPQGDSLYLELISFPIDSSTSKTPRKKEPQQNVDQLACSPSIRTGVSGVVLAPTNSSSRKRKLSQQQDEHDHRDKTERGYDGMNSVPHPTTIASELKHEEDISKAAQGVFCVCTKKFQSKELLNLHIQRTSKLLSMDRKFQCNICKNRFRMHGDLQKHLRKVHKVTKSRSKGMKGCTECGRLFKSMRALRQHRTLEHANASAPRLGNINMKEGANVTVTSTLSPKVQSVRPLVPIENIKSEVSSQQHPSSNEGGQHGIDRSKARQGKYFCRCGRDSKTIQKLRKHIKWQMTKHHFKCPLCPDRFKSTSILKLHMRKKHNKQYDLKGCSCCGNVYKTYGELRQHQSNSNCSRKRKIAEVDLTGSQISATTSGNVRESKSSRLKISTLPGTSQISSRKTKSVIRIPSITIPIAQKNMLSVTKKKHGMDNSRRHLGYFYCICNTRFTKEKYLNRHIAYFNNEKKFQCQLCSSSFLFRSHLNTHMKKKHKIVVFMQAGSGGCSECGLVFPTHSALYQHRKAAHTNPGDIGPDCQGSSSLQIAPSTSSIASQVLEMPPVSSVLSASSSSPLTNSKTDPSKQQNSALLNHGINLLKLPGEYFCVCGSQFGNMNSLRNHIILRNKDDVLTKIHENSKSSSIPNQNCSLVASSTTAMSHVISATKKSLENNHTSNTTTLSKFHKRIRFPNKPDVFYCFCGLQYENSQLLQKHLEEFRLAVPVPVPSTSLSNKISDLAKSIIGVRSEEVEIEQPQISENQQISAANSNARVPESFVITSSICTTTTDNLETAGHAFDESKESQGFFCVCGLQFSSRDIVSVHTQFHALGKRFPCHLCTKLFRSLREMNKHKKNIHGANDKTGYYGCSSCGVIFASVREIAQHRMKVFSAGKLANVFCPSKLCSTSELQIQSQSSNKRTKGANHNKETQNTTSGTTPASEKWYPVTPSISVRIGSSSNGADGVLTPCNTDRFIESGSMPLLQSNNRPIQSQSPSHAKHGVDPLHRTVGFFCYCGQECSDKETLSRHIKRAKAERKFICKSCGEGFPGASLLRKHLLRVHKIVQTTSAGCKECGEFFPTNMELYHHYRIVHNLGSQWEPWETKYTPPTPSSSSQQPEMSQELPIELDGDEAKAKEKSSEIHQPVPQDPLSENPRSPFQCTCGQVFGCRSSLRNHVRRKTFGKIFKCSWCTLRFDTHGNLKNHVRRVHKMEYQKGKYACGICAQTFQVYDDVKIHRRTAHQQQHNNSDNSIYPESNDIDGTAQVDLTVFES